MIFSFLLSGIIVPAAEPDSLVPDRVYRETIKTVLLFREGWELSAPLIKLNSDETLKLTFDDLDGDVKDYSFTIVHCNHLWEPSGLQPFEYIDGYTEDEIHEHEFSRNTVIDYTHYTAWIPNDDIRPKLSGNYLLKVWDSETEEICFTRRFMVFEELVDIKGDVRPSTRVEERKSRQKVEFSIDAGSFRIDNPYRNLFAVIIRNNCFETAIYDLQPKMIIGNKIDYSHDEGNVFDGGNEYRNFEIRDMGLPFERVEEITLGQETYTVRLAKDESMAFQVYKTMDDVNGRFKIDKSRSEFPETEAEYVYVEFSLSLPYPMADAAMYIDGAFCRPSFCDECKMKWNLKKKLYEKTLLLKQGYYNYRYVRMPVITGEPEIGYIEGNHSETENEYTVYVYYFDISLNCEILAGVRHITTGN